MHHEFSQSPLKSSVEIVGYISCPDFFLHPPLLAQNSVTFASPIISSNTHVTLFEDFTGVGIYYADGFYWSFLLVFLLGPWNSILGMVRV